MRKEDFIEGKWYVSSFWQIFKAAKFKRFTAGGDFMYSQAIENNNNFKTNENYTNSDKGNWSSFKEVSIEELKEYLPKDHPDLIITNIYELWN